MWEAGDPLRSAWAQVAVLFDRIAQMPVKTHPTKGIKFARRDQSTSSKWIDRARLLEAIHTGRLWAIGIQRRPSGLSELVLVPRECFFFSHEGDRGGSVDPPDIHWRRGELIVAGTSYIDIRVFRAPVNGEDRSQDWPIARVADALASRAKRRMADRLKTRTTGSKPKKEAMVSESVDDDRASNARGRKVERPFTKDKRSAKDGGGKKTTGRPNTADKITKTAQRLWKTNPDFRTLPLKLMVLDVRAAIFGKELGSQEIAGYKSSSMAKTIGPALKALRNPTKQNKRNK
jgi:hypothetical protein